MKAIKYIPKLMTVAGLLVLIAICNSCKKFLDEKPVKALVTPSTLNDLQALLDNHNIMNERSPLLSILAADDYYFTTDIWQGRSVEDRLIYIWDPTATYLNSWKPVYQGPIYYANVVLDALPAIEESGSEYNSVKGAALFYRGFNFQLLAQLYCRPYSTTASTDLGLPLRLTGAIEEPSVRSTVQKTYDQIVADLLSASELLPENTLYPAQPTKAAAYGALSRTYLSMRDYVNAARYADSCLKRYNTLIDYNTLLPATNPVFKKFNKETIFYNHAVGNSSLSNTRAKIDSNLFVSYDSNDLRKTLFFQQNTGTLAGTYGFRGSYDGEYLIYSTFDGIATDEIYLIRAESYARLGNKDGAMADLNTLLTKRWRSGFFVPLTATDVTDAQNKILTERRKELVYRGLRWSDIRRFNLDGANINLTRIINGTTYNLPANDLRFVMLIPWEVINLSGMPQNPR